MLSLQVGVFFLHNYCSYAAPSTHFDFLPPKGEGIGRPGQLICNPLSWVLHGVQSLSSWPYSGLVSSMRSYNLNFSLGPFCLVMAMLGGFGRVGQLARRTRSGSLLGGCTLSQEEGDVSRQIWLLT